MDFKFEDKWFDSTDRAGFSLTAVNAGNAVPIDWGQKSGWQSSSHEGGSPGFRDAGAAR